MKGWPTLIGALAVAVLPELIAAWREERARRWAAEEEARGRRHDAQQRDLDRQNARVVAHIEAAGAADR